MRPAVLFCGLALACASFPRADLDRLRPEDRRTCLTWEANAREAYKPAVMRDCIRKFEHIYEMRK